jgi:hypothetical protein
MKTKVLSGTALAAAAIALALGGAVVTAEKAQAHGYGVHKHHCRVKAHCKHHHHCRTTHHCKR